MNESSASSSPPSVRLSYDLGQSNNQETTTQIPPREAKINAKGISILEDTKSSQSSSRPTSLSSHELTPSPDPDRSSKTSRAFDTVKPQAESNTPSRGTRTETVPKQKNPAKGIEKLKDQISTNEKVTTEFSIPKVSKDFREYDTEKSAVPGQKIVGTKKRGVEPGFIANKTWTDTDNAKLLNPQHKFNKAAVKYLLKNDPEFAGKSKAEVRQVLEKALQDPSTYGKVKDHLMTEFSKFKKNHYWKLDYAEPTGRNKEVSIDAAQEKGALHRMGTAGSRRSKNVGGVMEVLANDVFNALGFGGQKLSLRLGNYQDEHPKFLVDGTHVQGENGEKFQTINDSKVLLEGPETQGRIEGNLLPDPDNPGKFVPMNEEQWGSGLLKALLLGDRDKLGSQGDNLGYIVVDTPDGKREAVPQNIDPGKSFEDSLLGLDRMAVTNDIHSDCTFEHRVGLTDNVIGGYKNFSIFSDTTFADKMQGMKDINAKWPEVLKIFEDYIKFFKENENTLDPSAFRKAGEPPIHALLQTQLTRLKTRKANFDKVFGDRVNLDKNQLNLLDNLEKLTSVTTNKAKVSKDKKATKIILKHLAVVDPKKNRKEWSFFGETALIFVPKDESEHKKILSTLEYYTKSTTEKAELAKDLKILLNQHPDNKLAIILNFSKEKFDDLMELFSEKNISHHKGQYLK
jgi:hypothetical protein